MSNSEFTSGNVIAPSLPSSAPVENPQAPASPLRTIETFEAYCTQVQSRLAVHAAQRRRFLQAAHDRLSALLQAAAAVEDAALARELAQHRATARELLETLNCLVQTAAPASGSSPGWPSVPPPSKPLPLNQSNGYHTPYPGAGSAPTARSPQPAPDGNRMETREPASPNPLFPTQEDRPREHAVVSTPSPPRLPRRPVRPLADIEADAIRQRESIRDWNSRNPLLTPGGDLNAPNCLLLRAVACRQRRLEEEAGDTEVAEVTELANDIVALLDAADDQEYTVALDYELDPRPTAFQWGELAERYEEMARAQEAFEWWNENRGRLTVQDIQPVAEAVAAIQQRFNRLLFRIGARDPFQQQLFDDLRFWAREAQCYLQSLRPKVPIAELIERAATLDSAWNRVGEPNVAPEPDSQPIEEAEPVAAPVPEPEPEPEAVPADEVEV